MSLTVYLFHFFVFFFVSLLRDAKLFNIAVDAEKKKQLELEMQVLSCSLSACTLVPFVTVCLLIELFCFLVAVLFLSRISNIKIQLLNNFTGHQSANTTKIRRVQKFK